MTDDSDPEDNEFVVVTPDEPAPAIDEMSALADGRGARSRREFLETRERLSAVEQQVSQNGDLIERVDDKLDDIKADVERVDDNALDREYFEEEYRGDINTNSDITTVAVWVGGVLLALIGGAATLLSTGSI